MDAGTQPASPTAAARSSGDARATTIIFILLHNAHGSGSSVGFGFAGKEALQAQKGGEISGGNDRQMLVQSMGWTGGCGAGAMKVSTPAMKLCTAAMKHCTQVMKHCTPAMKLCTQVMKLCMLVMKHSTPARVTGRLAGKPGSLKVEAAAPGPAGSSQSQTPCGPVCDTRRPALQASFQEEASYGTQ
jgi:hypothetical protein